jgi:hypothetical protein
MNNKDFAAIARFATMTNSGQHNIPVYSVETYRLATAVLAETNIKSVLTRYKDSAHLSTEGLIGDAEEALNKAVAMLHLVEGNPVAVLKLCDCYDYQACEFDGYRESMAAKIVAKARKNAIKELPGYDAAPWGSP